MKCNNRPDCLCEFCVRLRNRLSAREEQDLLAFCWLRDREMDAEMDTNWCLADDGRFLNRVTGEVIVWEVEGGTTCFEAF